MANRERVHRRPASGLNPVVGNALAGRLGANLRILGIEEDVELRLVEVLGVRRGGCLEHPVSVVQEETEIAQSAHARLGADRRLARLDTREAQGALLRLTGAVVEV